MSKNAGVLWTGGKDSSLALYEAKLLGYEIASLVTFVPDKPEFLAHPLNFMKYQADALGLPHHTIAVNEPFKASYERAIHSLREEHQTEVLISGDIAEVDGHPNWIKECSKNTGVDVLTPLWQWDRLEILHRLLLYRFRVLFSCVKKPWFTDEWLGMELNMHSLERLCKMNATTGLDICGEQGEYHTLVVDGPPFNKSIEIGGYCKRSKGPVMYIELQELSVKDK